MCSVLKCDKQTFKNGKKSEQVFHEFRKNGVEKIIYEFSNPAMETLYVHRWYNLKTFTEMYCKGAGEDYFN